MKINEVKKFDKFCGLALIEHEGEKWFVAFCHAFEERFSFEEGNLGAIIGKGKTEIEALGQAMCVLRKKYVQVYSIQEKLENFSKKLFDNFHGFDKKPIFPINSWTTVYDEENNIQRYVDTDEMVNAELFETEDGLELGRS